jgi:hypothetical protein
MSEDTRQTFLVLYTRLSVSKNGREVSPGILRQVLIAYESRTWRPELPGNA